MNVNYSPPTEQRTQTEKEEVENLLEQNFSFSYFFIQSFVFIAIGIVELALVIVSRSDYGPVPDIGLSLISASTLIVLGILSILLILYRSYSVLKLNYYSYSISMVLILSGLIGLNILSISSIECFPNEPCKLKIHIIMLILGIVSFIGNIAHILILETFYF